MPLTLLPAPLIQKAIYTSVFIYTVLTLAIAHYNPLSIIKGSYLSYHIICRKIVKRVYVPIHSISSYSETSLVFQI